MTRVARSSSTAPALDDAEPYGGDPDGIPARTGLGRVTGDTDRVCYRVTDLASPDGRWISGR